MLQQREIRRHVRETLINIYKERKSHGFFGKPESIQKLTLKCAQILVASECRLICIVLYRNLIILLLFWLWPAAKIQSEKLLHEKAGSFSVLLETD